VLAGENCAVSPVGNPVTVNVMAALKVEFGVVVSSNEFELPAETLVEVTEGAKVNVGAGAMVTAIETCCFMEPLVADTVTV
jgi:hypothetical protein